MTALVTVDIVQELARDRVLRLEDVARLDHHAVVSFIDDGSKLVVVARDDALTFHPTSLLSLSRSSSPKVKKGNPASESSV
jgi:hypothetical protein